MTACPRIGCCPLASLNSSDNERQGFEADGPAVPNCAWISKAWARWISALCWGRSKGQMPTTRCLSS